MANGVCHTDLHAANGDWMVKPIPPFIPGHEGVEVIAAVGTPAGVTGFKEGDPAGVAWLYDACGWCDYCRTGWDVCLVATGATLASTLMAALPST